MLHLDAVALTACALAALLLSLLLLVLRHLQEREPADERRLAAEVAAVEASAARLSKVADFVEVSLLERRAIRLRKERDALARARAADRTAYDPAALASRFAQPALLLLITLLLWGRPLATGLPVHALGPGVGTLLAFPGLPRGSLGVVAWLSICSATAGALTSAAGRALGLVKSESGAGGMQQLLRGLLS